METVSNICAVIVGVSMFVTPVLFLIWAIKKLRKKPAKKMGISTLIGATCFVVFLFAGAFTDPATYCDHEYKLVDSETATCEKGGYEKYHCDLCGRDKTEKLKKLGHDMVDERRIEATEDTDGEFVRKCSRCGYEEIDILKKPKKSTETKTPTESGAEGETKNTTEPERDDGEKVDLSVTFDEIYYAYKENELVADDNYQFNRYRITAKINGMETDGIFNLTGGATLTMEKRVGNTHVFFYAEFEKEQEEALKTVKVGDTITFEGECLSAGTWSDCELITE